MTNDMLHIGSVVLSVRGRDKGNYFTVVALVDDIVYIADGDKHKLSSPKKKISNTFAVAAKRLTVLLTNLL